MISAAHARSSGTATRDHRSAAAAPGSSKGLMVCKLCKRPVSLDAGVFFQNGRTRELTDFQCRTCTRWELSPASGPGNIRTDLVHYE